MLSCFMGTDRAVARYRRIHAIIYRMSRKQKFPGTSSASKVVADYINQLAKARCAKQTDLGRVLRRSQSYVQTRCSGLQSWSLDDIDALAKYFGFPNAFALLDKARGIQ